MAAASAQAAPREASRTRVVSLAVVLVLVIATFALAAPAARADGPTTFSNTTALAIPATGSANQIGPASPYPSQIAVSGMTGAITNVTVTLTGLTHSTLNDVDALLVAPNGANLVFLSDVGDPNTAAWTTNATLTFDDAASAPVTAGNVPSGTYRPTNVNPVTTDAFPAPAPTPSGSTTFAQAFTGLANANGTWSLYVVDDATGDIGQLTGGWSLTITSTTASVATTTSVTTSGTPSATGAAVTFTARVTSGAGGAAVTTGGVRFFDGANPLGGVVPLNGSGVATLTTSGLGEGTHSIRADYGGATGFLTSSGSVEQRVDNATVVTGQTSCNPGALTIPQVGAATPYPSHVTVSGITGTVTGVSVSLLGVSHTAPIDLDVMVSGPAAGSNVVLLSDGGGQSAVSGVDLVFADGAAGLVPEPMASGTYLPTRGAGSALAFPAPAPAPSTATTLATFAGPAAAVNGTWGLWLVDDATGDSGSVSGGWCLTVVTAPVTPTISAGGPYSVAEGESLALAGMGDGEGVGDGSYGWDLNGDDVFTDATGLTPTLTWAQLETFGVSDGPATHTIRMRSTSGGQGGAGGSVDAPVSATLAVTNTAPGSVVTGSLAATVGSPLTLKVGAADPSSVDTAGLFTYTVDWGDGSPVESVVGPADPPVTHTYATAGNYSATFCAQDKDGGTGGGTVVTVAVTVAATASPSPSVSPSATPSGTPSATASPTAMTRPATRYTTRPTAGHASHRHLASTGASGTAGPAVTGLALMVVGAAAVAVARRRRRLL